MSGIWDVFVFRSCESTLCISARHSEKLGQPSQRGQVNLALLVFKAKISFQFISKTAMKNETFETVSPSVQTCNEHVTNMLIFVTNIEYMQRILLRPEVFSRTQRSRRWDSSVMCAWEQCNKLCNKLQSWNAFRLLEALDKGFQIEDSIANFRSSICCSCVRATLSSCLEQQDRDFQLTQLTLTGFGTWFDSRHWDSLSTERTWENIQRTWEKIQSNVYPDLTRCSESFFAWRIICSTWSSHHSDSQHFAT